MGEAERSVSCTRRDFLAAWWRGDAGPVPCGGCSACCYYDGIPVDEKRDRRRLPYLVTERNADGGLVLQRRADGACAHLGAQGCTVYEHRPSACRSFDCRAFAAMGLVEHCDPNHHIPDWEFAEDAAAGRWPVLVDCTAPRPEVSAGAVCASCETSISRGTPRALPANRPCPT